MEVLWFTCVAEEAAVGEVGAIFSTIETPWLMARLAAWL
jgi:hypothetical protein